MERNGKLFVFEGPDGSGKSSLSAAFAAYLKTKTIETKYYSFPGNESGSLGELVYSLHHEPLEKGVQSLTPASLQLLHIAAHIDAIESKILPAIRTGVSVVLDRYWWSTFVYGKINGIPLRTLESMLEVECLVWEGLRPFRIFLIRRKSSLKTEPVREYARISAEYDELSLREAAKNDVRYIDNDSSFEETLRALMTEYA